MQIPLGTMLEASYRARKLRKRHLFCAFVLGFTLTRMKSQRKRLPRAYHCGGESLANKDAS